MGRAEWLSPTDESRVRMMLRYRRLFAAIPLRRRLLLGYLAAAMAELDDRRRTQATGGPEPANQNPGEWDNVGGAEGPPPDETMPAAELARRAAWGRGYRPGRGHRVP